MLNSPKRIQIAHLLAVVAAFGVSGPILHAVGRPAISVDTTSVGFGSVPDDRPVEHCFVISNRGDTVLSIDRITGDCDGCLSHSLETNAIAPGRTAVIEVTLDTGVLEGPVAKNLILRSNDAETPVLILSLWGTVAPGYTVRPRAVFFNPADGEHAATQSVQITGRAGSSSPLSLVSCSTNCFAGRLLQREGGAGMCELTVTTVPPLPEGLTRGELVLATTNSTDPRCVVRVAAYVPPVFSVIPDKLTLMAIDEEQERIVFVRQHSAKPARLLDVKLPAQCFACEINPGPGSADYRLHVRAKGLAGKQGSDKLVIKTDDPFRAEVAIPVEVR